jgi:ribosomal protein S1
MIKSNQINNSAISVDFPENLKVVKSSKFNILSGTDSILLKEFEKYFSSVQTVDEPNKGDIIKGKIISINENEVHVEASSKSIGIMPYRGKDKKIFLDLGLKVGDSAEFLVKESQSSRFGGIILSLSDLVQKQTQKALLRDINSKEKTVFSAKVIELIRGGFWVDINSVKCYMPGSLADINILRDFHSLVGKTVNVYAVGYANNSIIVSHKDYCQDMLKLVVKEIKVGEEYQGVVTGCSNFGVFLQFNGILTGLIHKDDLDIDTANSFKNGTINIGDVLNFKIKNIVNEKRIILTQLEIVDSWDETKRNNPVGTAEMYKCTSITKNNMAVFKISEEFNTLIKNKDSLEKGKKYKLIINNYDDESKKIFANLVK